MEFNLFISLLLGWMFASLSIGAILVIGSRGRDAGYESENYK